MALEPIRLGNLSIITKTNYLRHMGKSGVPNLEINVERNDGCSEELRTCNDSVSSILNFKKQEFKVGKAFHYS